MWRLVLGCIRAAQKQTRQLSSQSGNDLMVRHCLKQTDDLSLTRHPDVLKATNGHRCLTFVASQSETS